MDRQMKILLLLCVFAAFPVACTPCDLDSTARTQEGKRAVLRIVLGEGGGISGKWEGHTIAGDGAVYAWSGRAARENEHEVGRMPADTMCALWDVAKTLSTVPQVDSSGSLVRFLSVTIQDSTWKYSWRPQLGRDLPKSSYQEIYDRCSAAITHSLTPTPTATPSTK
jgi:hypothetical protein